MEEYVVRIIQPAACSVTSHMCFNIMLEPPSGLRQEAEGGGPVLRTTWGFPPFPPFGEGLEEGSPNLPAPMCDLWVYRRI